MSKEPKSRLTPHIERMPTPAVPRNDSVDAEISTFIEAFLDDLPDAVRLGKMSLLTQEDAKQAVAMLDQTLSKLNEKLKNAQALQQLVLTRKPGS